jgi:sec-independent protein translocase protein TatA
MHLLVVLVIALIVLGPKKLPGAGRALGQGLREFKDSISGAGQEEEAAQLPAGAGQVGGFEGTPAVVGAPVAFGGAGAPESGAAVAFGGAAAAESAPVAAGVAATSHESVPVAAGEIA